MIWVNATVLGGVGLVKIHRASSARIRCQRFSFEGFSFKGVSC